MYFIKKREPEPNKALNTAVKIIVILGVIAAAFMLVRYYCKKRGIKCPICDFGGGCDDDMDMDMDMEDIMGDQCCCCEDCGCDDDGGDKNPEDGPKNAEENT